MLISRVNIFDIREQRSRINPVCCNEIVGGKRGMGIETESGTEVNMQLGSNLRSDLSSSKTAFLVPSVQMNCGLASNRNYLEQSAWIHPPLHARWMRWTHRGKYKYSNMHNSHGTRELCWRTQLFLVFLPDGGCFWFPFKYSSFRWSCFCRRGGKEIVTTHTRVWM